MTKLKVANIDIQGHCNSYLVLKIYGIYADYFEANVRDKALYLVKCVDSLPVGNISITLSLEDPSGRIDPVTANYTLTISVCELDCIDPIIPL